MKRYELIKEFKKEMHALNPQADSITFWIADKSEYDLIISIATVVRGTMVEQFVLDKYGDVRMRVLKKGKFSNPLFSLTA